MNGGAQSAGSTDLADQMRTFGMMAGWESQERGRKP